MNRFLTSGIARCALPSVVVCLVLVPTAQTLAEPAAAVLWVARASGPGNGSDGGLALGSSPDGTTIFVAATIERSLGNSDFAVLAYDAATGRLRWVRRLDLTDHDVPHGIAVSPDGAKVFVTGEVDGRITPFRDYATVALDATTGSPLWLQRYNGTGDGIDIAYSVAVTLNGSTVVVTGSSRGGVGHYYDYATIGYDAGTGAQRWLRRDDVSGGAYTALASPDGSKVLVTGQGDGDDGGDFVTLAYDPDTGSLLWKNAYDGPLNTTDRALAMALNPDASTVFVTGRSTEGGLVSDYGTVAIDASTGVTKWSSDFNGLKDGNDEANAIGVSPDGSTAYITGESKGIGSNYDFLTIAYDAATGSARWLKRYNGPGNDADVARSIAVSPDGRFTYVSGYSAGEGTGYDFAVVAYDAISGARSGVRRYDGPSNGDDYENDMTLTADGSELVVTGSSEGVTTGPDITTVAYSA